MLPLECLQCNEKAEIAEVVGDPLWVARMADLGVQNGAHLRMVAPGTTCMFELGHCKLCLRTDPSNCIYVRPLTESARVATS